MYVLVFTCMCVAAEYRKEGLQKTSKGCNRNCTLTMHYLKKTRKKKRVCLSTSGQCPLPADFFCVLFFLGRMARRSDKVALPSLLLIIQTLASVTLSQSSDSTHTSGRLLKTLDTLSLSAICRCCQISLFRQGSFSLS